MKKKKERNKTQICQLGGILYKVFKTNLINMLSALMKKVDNVSEHVCKYKQR